MRRSWLILQTLPKTRLRAGFSVRGLILAIVLLFTVPTIAWSLLRSTYWSSQTGKGPTMHLVERGRFVHELIEQGDIESARNVEIVSKVKSGYGGSSGGTAILWIIPEGTYVEEGDKLVELDSAALELERIQQEITVSNSAAAVAQAQSSLDTAEISLDEYLEGTYAEDLLTIENQIEEATEQRDRLYEYWKFSENMNAQGYVTDLQLQADLSALNQAENKLKLTELKRDVLEQYKKKKMVLQLEADISTAEARLAAEEASHQLDQERLDDIVEQIANCTIFATTAGQVVYANREGRRSGEGQVVIEEGTMIRERQAIIRMPDPKNMQVAAEVNEAKVSLIKRGMPATIRIDAFPDEVLQGQVVDVKEYPVPTNFGSAVKEYETVIKILDHSIDLRPGYTAVVRILVEQLEDVLQVPVQALIEHNSKHYCVVPNGDRFEAREVTIGSTNDKFVVIEAGLEEGESVVFNAASYRDEVGLPEESEEDRMALGQSSMEPYAEYQPGMEQPAGGAGAGPLRGQMPSPAQMMANLDTNGNGQIDADELAVMPGEMQSRMMAADTNGDGAIDAAEWAAAMAQFSIGSARGGTPPGGAPGSWAPDSGFRP